MGGSLSNRSGEALGLTSREIVTEYVYYVYRHYSIAKVAISAWSGPLREKARSHLAIYLRSTLA